jgi:hypothetical protein
MTNTNIFTGSATHHILKTAPSRGVSPTRAHSPRPTPAPRMPSPRTSPALRPKSPLSPRLESSARFESLQSPSPRSMHRTAGNTQRRANTISLKLPSLPRFHPMNFADPTDSSCQNTPDSTGMGTPQQPVSSITHQRVVSDAQKRVLLYQREMVAAARASSPFQHPASPRLAPLGSPGPVTPLELEGDEGYLVAGTRNTGRQDGIQSDELVDRLIKEEKIRQRRTPSNSPSRPGSR